MAEEKERLVWRKVDATALVAGDALPTGRLAPALDVALAVLALDKLDNLQVMKAQQRVRDAAA